jgi:hypothetical protein
LSSLILNLQILQKVMKFAKQEYVNLHLLYGETRGNSRPARRPYGERFPEGVLPSRCTFVELHLPLGEVGSDCFQYDGVPDPPFNPSGF